MQRAGSQKRDGTESRTTGPCGALANQLAADRVVFVVKADDQVPAYCVIARDAACVGHLHGACWGARWRHFGRRQVGRGSLPVPGVTVLIPGQGAPRNWRLRSDLRDPTISRRISQSLKRARPWPRCVSTAEPRSQGKSTTALGAGRD